MTCPMGLKSISNAICAKVCLKPCADGVIHRDTDLTKRKVGRMKSHDHYKDSTKKPKKRIASIYMTPEEPKEVSMSWQEQEILDRLVATGEDVVILNRLVGSI